MYNYTCSGRSLASTGVDKAIKSELFFCPVANPSFGDNIYGSMIFPTLFRLLSVRVFGYKKFVWGSAPLTNALRWVRFLLPNNLDLEEENVSYFAFAIESVLV